MATDEKKSEKAEVFDFATLETTETAIVPIINPNTDEDIPGVTMELYSPESQFAKDAETSLRAAIQIFSSRNPGARQKVRMAEFDRLNRIKNISMIKSINGFVYNGKNITDPKEVCEKFEFVYTQAVNRLSTLSNFIKG